MIPAMRRVVLSLLVFLLAAEAEGRWYGPADNQDRSVLASWDAKALFAEAFEVCVRRAQLLGQTPNREQAALLAAAEEYLSVIEDVVREHSGGRVPQWLRSLSFARSVQDCQAVFRAFLGGETAPETEPAVGGKEKKGAPTATPKPSKPNLTGQPTRTPTTTPVIRVPAFPVLWFSPTVPMVKSPRPTHSPRPTRTPRATRSVIRPTPTVANGQGRKVPQDEVTDELPPWFR
jgi:hypothetical protein